MINLENDLSLILDEYKEKYLSLKDNSGDLIALNNNLKSYDRIFGEFSEKVVERINLNGLEDEVERDEVLNLGRLYCKKFVKFFA